MNNSLTQVRQALFIPPVVEIQPQQGFFSCPVSEQALFRPWGRCTSSDIVRRQFGPHSLFVYSAQAFVENKVSE
ncbi:hypothetical protein RGV33_27570 [Pseudomonas sp. Bout1]|uniref:hypothetical protein n=1 Tax=Pseudomonas sp. Bout1 TaxID=3048600 RepID=UPI002AB5CF02|nr:hypothetical protein [Pseudomonas sp. Bout1]MDY7535390.1 hypothetical protein [Pseudomonas sp. Bout1]MEB0187581.1 hypothetical protein [Pseudomonas sp. Bout1]